MKRRVLALLLAVGVGITAFPSGTLCAFAAEAVMLEEENTLEEENAIEENILEEDEIVLGEILRETETASDVEIPILEEETELQETEGLLAEKILSEEILSEEMLSEKIENRFSGNIQEIFRSAPELTLDAEINISLNQGECAYYKYHPKEDTSLVIYSMGENDTIVTLYAGKETEDGFVYEEEDNLEDDDSGEDSNFRLAAELRAGGSYLYEIKGCKKGAITNCIVKVRKRKGISSITVKPDRSVYSDLENNIFNNWQFDIVYSDGETETVFGLRSSTEGYEMLPSRIYSETMDDTWKGYSNLPGGSYKVSFDFSNYGITDTPDQFIKVVPAYSMAEELNIDGETVLFFKAATNKYYKYEPAEDTEITIYSMGSYDFYVNLYELDAVGELQLLDGDDDSGEEGLNFSLTTELKAGKKYLYVISANGSGMGMISGSIVGSHMHKTVTDPAEAPTCAETGKTEGKHCSICRKVINAQKTIPATGKHVYGTAVVTKEATALAEGEAVSTCTVCGAKRSEVIPKLAAAITLNAPKSIPMKIKQTFTIKVSGLAKGDRVASWKSSKASVVTVKNGKLTAKKAGTAKITVTLASGKTAQVTVKVQKAAVKTTRISFVGTGKKLTLKKGKKLTLKTQRTPVTSLEKVTFTTSNKKCVTVTSKGVIKGIKKGKAVITAKSGKKSVKVTVTVK